MINIGIVDDHQLFVKSLSLLLSTFQHVNVVFEANNGIDAQKKLSLAKQIPDILLLDVNMPEMDGIATAKWVQQSYPLIKLVALSTNNTDHVIIDMISAGCCAYLLKDTHPNELEKAIQEIFEKGYYNGDVSNINFRRLLKVQEAKESLQLTEKEKLFLQYACSDMTYKQIAHLMNVSERTIDAYREALFGKLHVQSRVGLCMEAIKRVIVKLEK